MAHFKYIPVLALLGLILAVAVAAVDKLFIKKIADEKKRKYVKIASDVIIYFIAACVVVEVLDWAKQ